VLRLWEWIKDKSMIMQRDYYQHCWSGWIGVMVSIIQCTARVCRWPPTKASATFYFQLHKVGFNLSFVSWVSKSHEHLCSILLHVQFAAATAVCRMKSVAVSFWWIPRLSNYEQYIQYLLDTISEKNTGSSYFLAD